MQDDEEGISEGVVAIAAIVLAFMLISVMIGVASCSIYQKEEIALFEVLDERLAY